MYVYILIGTNMLLFYHYGMLLAYIHVYQIYDYCTKVDLICKAEELEYGISRFLLCGILRHVCEFIRLCLSKLCRCLDLRISLASLSRC